MKKHYGWLIIVFASLLLMYLSVNFGITLSNFELRDESLATESVSLPLSRASKPAGGAYQLDGQLILGWGASKTLHITPDDEVKSIVINERDVDLSGISADQLSNWRYGFHLDASPYLHDGQNSISITFRDRSGGGLMGMKIQSQYKEPAVTVILALWFILAAAILAKTRTFLGISRVQTVLYVLIILGAVLQVWVICVHNPVDHVGSDAQRHWEQGVETLRNDLMSNTDPIMYQLFLGTLAKLTLGMSGLVAFYISILALITPWLWYRFFRELQSNKTLALAGWAVLSMLPSWMSIYGYYMQETLLLPLLGAALWATWRARRKATVGSFVLMVIVWIVAGLTRGVVIPFAAISCSALWLTQEYKLKKALISICILLFTLGPLTYRSYETVHHFAPHGMKHLASIYAMSGKREIVLRMGDNGSQGTYIFGSPSTGETPFAPLSNWHTRRSGRVVLNIDLGKGRQDWDKEYAAVKMSWEDRLWITKENLIFLFFGSSWPDNNPERIIDRANIVMRWIWAPGFLAAVIWVVVMRKRLRYQWLLPSMILAWFIVQGLLPISLNEGRYRKPLEGLLVAQFILLAAAGREQTRRGTPYNWGIEPFLKNRLNRELPAEKTDNTLANVDEPRPDQPAD